MTEQDKTKRPILRLPSSKKLTPSLSVKTITSNDKAKPAEESLDLQTKADIAPPTSASIPSNDSQKPRNKVEKDKTDQTTERVAKQPQQKRNILIKPKQTVISEEDYQQVLEYLQKHYPDCFPVKDTPVALALGIHNQIFDIVDLPFSRMIIRKFLGKYANSKEYKKALILGADRFNLDSSFASKILELELDYWKWKRLQNRNKVEKNAEAAKKANHDLLIKKAMESPIAAKELMSEYLPEVFKEYIDLTTLKIEKESYIEDSLKSRFSDIVYSAKTIKKQGEDDRSEETALIYCLIEHQSSSDYWISLRLWKYSLLLLERHTKNSKKLPVILPLVLYNGQKKYTAPKNLWQLFTSPEIAKNAMSNDYTLIDLQAMDDDDIDYEKHLSFLLYTMKHIHDRDLLAMLKTAMQKCTKALIIDKGQDYVHTKLILWYTDSKVPQENKQALEQLIMDNLPKEDTENVMKTIADTYIDEGVEKGIAIGEARGIYQRNIDIAKRMLQEKTDLKFISSVTGLSSDEVLSLKNSI